MFTAQNRDVFTTINKGFTAAKSAAVLPATGNQTIFTVSGGRCLVGLLLGQVTTLCDATATNLKVTSVPTTGSAVDVAANLAVANFEAGAILVVEGDGSALIGTSAGAGFAPALTLVPWVVPIGILRITTSATNLGATKWDIWYLPLDSGASIQ
jgi:DNA-binding beta-propeller fold protein YncE